ncbi:MAG: GNAT family N-acetyltransferase [Alphaproteobacteria bacterium]|nr:GNAT family N-acetyltransferase [Alphaproteobacteria bacterium]
MTAPIVPADSLDPALLLALNTANQTETSELDADGLRDLLAVSWQALAIGRGDALLIAMDQDSAYSSPNFQWFKARHDRFAYVDRIIVDASARGRGLARHLYEHLFGLARSAGHDRIGCEVNLIPPNPGSDAFHARLGFEEVGQAVLYGGAKTVRYLEKPLGGG